MDYSFECRKCGERFRVQESLQQHEKHRETCPKCKSSEVEQKLEAPYVATAKKS